MKVYEVIGNKYLWGKRFAINGQVGSFVVLGAILYSYNVYFDTNTKSNCTNILDSVICNEITFEKTRDEKFEELADKKYTFYDFKSSVHNKLEVETTFSTLKDSGRHTTLNFKISSSEYDYKYIDLKFEDLETIYNFAKEIKEL